jgi:hypothetical protein
MANLRFWDALNGEAWYINATHYGHGDLLIEFLSDDVIGVSFFTFKNSTHLQESFMYICLHFD